MHTNVYVWSNIKAEFVVINVEVSMLAVLI